jgi:hypothetical protein
MANSFSSSLRKAAVPIELGRKKKATMPATTVYYIGIIRD